MCMHYQPHHSKSDGYSPVETYPEVSTALEVQGSVYIVNQIEAQGDFVNPIEASQAFNLNMSV